MRQWEEGVRGAYKGEEGLAGFYGVASKKPRGGGS